MGRDSSIAAAVFAGVLVWVALCFYMLWRYLAARPDRLISSVSKRDRRRISRTQVVALLLYAGAFLVAWVAPFLSIGITLALAIFFAVVNRLSGFASEDIAARETV